MEFNPKQLECRNFRPKTEENRKRAASGRLSPRSLFGNLKAKRPFQEEEDVSRNLNDSKTTHAWKPPLKLDSNEAIIKFSSHDCGMETLNNSFPNNKTSLSQNHNFIVNEQHYSGSNENVYPTMNGNYNIESGELFPGNSKETTVHMREFLSQNNLMDDQDLDYSENICRDLGNYINNSEDDSEIVVKQELDGIQTDCRQDQEDRHLSQPLAEKLDFSGNNHECVKRSFQESNNLPLPSPSRNEIHFQNQNYDENDTPSDETVKLERDNLGEDVDKESHYKDNDQEYSENSDSSKSSLELSDSKKFAMEPNYEENKNILYQEKNCGSFHEHNDMESSEFHVSKGVDDSFDTGVTNSQFLQLENQISKSSIGMNIMNNNNNNRPVLNNIETMKRYCTSLTTQTEWQKNVLKSIARDIDELNKAIVNATASLKSVRKDNASAK